ncbi:quinone oxidoreductase [Dongia soli]|uniref:Quinone oxidoreductase n=1 Tax=Dongia soli TaxID=600628 RepID=A0ABU5E700_9PROT|nr:quinone oxidoreductase [Dongia soli]MDY0881963.1 quinone oxidoreductase [Dongia soli]
MRVKAIRIHQNGGPDQMHLEEVELGAPGEGEVTLRNKACGVNFIDTYHRTGLYPVSLPSGLGLEASAVVEAVGPGVTDLKAGDRVAYSSAPVGAYAEARNYPAARLIKIPDAIDDKTAAAMMLQGMTAEYLIRRTYPVQKGDIVLLHAAAGGVGQIATQWLHHLGAIIIGTAGSAEKLKIASDLGCQHVINYRDPDWVAQVKAASGGQGVHVVYDGVGKDTFMPSLDCLRPRGYMVTYGNASGPVAPIEPLILSQKGSLFLTRPTLMAYTSSRADLELSANAVIDVISRGAVKINVNHTYALKDAAQAHRDLEGRKTTGSLVLIP